MSGETICGIGGRSSKLWHHSAVRYQLHRIPVVFPTLRPAAAVQQPFGLRRASLSKSLFRQQCRVPVPLIFHVLDMT
jgi:hypothetical protein